MLFAFLLSLIFSLTSSTQQNFNDLKWKNVVHDQPDSWYGSDEAIRVAENVLLYQRDIGGWPKNTAMHVVLSKAKKKELRELQSLGKGATTDNGATVLELDFLSKVYRKTKDDQYKKAFLRGINYLLEAQYDNGGWPQFFPPRKGYYTHITYNDNSMVNIMNVMNAIAGKSARFSIIADDATVLKAKTAFDKGIEIILKTQYKQNGVLTVWCAQHDESTFEPAQARSYELPSLSGGESAGIVLLLMKLERPSPEIVFAIQSAVTWFDKVKITGIRIERFITNEGIEDRKVVADKDAPAVWARFSELSDNRPFFCDRDGIKKYSLAEIGQERRNGYSWYGNAPQKVLVEYNSWQPKWASDKNVLSK